MTLLAPRPLPDRAAAAPAAVLPRADPIERLPVLVLEPHSRCDCRCRMCDIWRDRTTRQTGVAEVAEWLPEWRRLAVRRVVLSGGEPLLHRELPAIGGLLREAGIGVTLLSTGMTLARHAAAVAAFADDVIVSLDGPREVHDAIRRVPGAFERLAAGVAALAAAAPAVAVSARTTVQRDNHAHLCATVRAAREIGVGRLSFLAADVSSEAFNRPGGWDAERAGEVALGDDDLPRLAAEIDRLEVEHADDLASGFVAEDAATLRRRLVGHFAALLGRGEPAAPRCNAPWVSTVIEADGTVRPCFFQPPLGNVRTAGSLGAVLNAPASVAWRRGLDIERDAICRRCVCSLLLREEA